MTTRRKFFKRIALLAGGAAVAPHVPLKALAEAVPAPIINPINVYQHASIDVAALIREDMFKMIALAWDYPKR